MGLHDLSCGPGPNGRLEYSDEEHWASKDTIFLCPKCLRPLFKDEEDAEDFLKGVDVWELVFRRLVAEAANSA